MSVDEAHELENAAMSALSPELDSAALAELAAQVAEWAEDQVGLDGATQLVDAVTNLDRYLDDERLARAAMHAFDTAERDPLGRAVLRTVTVASPLQGDAFVADDGWSRDDLPPTPSRAQLGIRRMANVRRAAGSGRRARLRTRRRAC